MSETGGKMMNDDGVKLVVIDLRKLFGDDAPPADESAPCNDEARAYLGSASRTEMPRNGYAEPTSTGEPEATFPLYVARVELLSRLEKSDQEIRRLGRELEEVGVLAGKLKSELEQRDRQLVEAQENHHRVVWELGGVRKQLEQLQAKANQADAEIQRLRTENERLRCAIGKFHRAYDVYEAVHKELRDAVGVPAV